MGRFGYPYTSSESANTQKASVLLMRQFTRKEALTYATSVDNAINIPGQPKVKQTLFDITLAQTKEIC